MTPELATLAPLGCAVVLAGGMFVLAWLMDRMGK